jgi:hypothetical protein
LPPRAESPRFPIRREILVESCSSVDTVYMVVFPVRASSSSAEPFRRMSPHQSKPDNIELSRPADLRETARVWRTHGFPSRRQLRGRLQRFVRLPQSQTEYRLEYKKSPGSLVMSLRTNASLLERKSSFSYQVSNNGRLMAHQLLHLLCECYSTSTLDRYFSISSINLSVDFAMCAVSASRWSKSMSVATIHSTIESAPLIVGTI